jgi:predicted sulfurtransferase
LGTILLSYEGINFFLSGKQESIDIFLEFLDHDERLAGIKIKFSYSEKPAFRKMYVRLKKEIISMGCEEIKPEFETGTSISPTEFKHWLDEGKEVTILDTRNDYEIRVGTFSNAIDFDIPTFREFPKAVEECSLDKEKPIVMFCTGGIRCEKASQLMINQGFLDVRQLEGGILGYFEEVGGDYWDGDCFVFDRRVAVDSNLQETEAVVCYACREPLSLDEQDESDYILGMSCPYCSN